MMIIEQVIDYWFGRRNGKKYKKGWVVINMNFQING